MKLTDKSGNPLEKRILVCLFKPDGSCQKVRFLAPPGRAFSDSGIDELLMDFVTKVDKAFPGHEFEMVQVSRAQFNFVCRGEKIAQVTTGVSDGRESIAI